MIPTSIDGTDITGATIDGQDVQEITVDGDTVFSGTTLPVAYSNLVGWYPFDSAEYGGSDADDVTAIIGGSGDDTAYDGTVNGATYQSSGGATDINAGGSSGYYDFDGSDIIDLGSSVFDPTSAFTVTHWIEADQGGFAWGDNDNTDGIRNDVGSGELSFEDGGTLIKTTYSGGTGSFDFYAFTYDGSSDVEVYKNSGTSPIATDTGQTSGSSTLGLGLGGKNPTDARIACEFDDFRVYNRVLSGSEIDQIHTNTEP